MPPAPKLTLISTVGTSLLGPGNLGGLKVDDPDPVRARLASARDASDWEAVGSALREVSPSAFLCGAEINSLTSLFAKGYAAPDANLFFCHSATAQGRDIGLVLVAYYRGNGHHKVEAKEIADLQDEDPARFRTHGLRNLAKLVCEIVRDFGPATSAINATGGYKAQIAIAVMMGQALGVPVYYKHERFDEIIAFPPMPVALDAEAWMRLKGVLAILERDRQVPADDFLEDVARDAELFESLVERVEIDGRAFLDLSPAGQIFQETFRDRYKTLLDQMLPPAVPPARKQPIHWEDSGHMRDKPEVARFLKAVTDGVPQVARCATFYANDHLPTESRFRVGSRGIEGIYSDGSYTVKFRVDTSAQTPGQVAAVVAALNEWLEARGR